MIPKHRKQSLEELAAINDAQPFHIYGASRVKDGAKLPDADPLQVIVNEGAGTVSVESPVLKPDEAPAAAEEAEAVAAG